MHTNVNAFYVFPEEIKQETGFRLPVIFLLEKDGRLPERFSYKLCFEVGDAATGKVISFDPLKMGVIDLIHYMMAYDFRSIDIRIE